MIDTNLIESFSSLGLFKYFMFSNAAILVIAADIFSFNTLDTRFDSINEV